MATHKKRRSKLSKTTRAAQFFQKDEVELHQYCLDKKVKLAEAIREAVFDGLKFRRLLAGELDRDELDQSGRPVKLPDLTLDTLNDAIQARLGGIEETLKAVLPRERGETGRVGKEAVAQDPMATSRPVKDIDLFKQFFGSLAEHIYFLRLESEFTFRLTYCIRELVKEFLVREKLLPKVPLDQLPAEGPEHRARLEKLLKVIANNEIKIQDGKAQEALKNIRAGTTPSMSSGDPSDYSSGSLKDMTPQRGFNPTQEMLDEIVQEINLDAVLDHLANEEGGYLDENPTS
jgi:hypothetical protein